jgi:two-component system response regulator YesN
MNELKKISTKLFGTGSRVLVNPKISNLIGNAISEFSSEKPYAPEILKNIFNQIAIYLIRDFSNVKDGTAKFTENEILCYQVMNYVDTHIYSITNLENISPKFNYNYSYLSTLFKKTTGRTLFEYYQDSKLKTAKCMLGENKMKIGEIAEQLNYSSVYAFSKAYKKKYGVSPSTDKNK